MLVLKIANRWRHSLHLRLNGLLLAHVLLSAVVQDGLDSVAADILHHRLDGLLILPRYVLTKYGALHRLVEQPPAQDAATKLHQLKNNIPAKL